jgi:hypothetical protein
LKASVWNPILIELCLVFEVVGFVSEESVAVAAEIKTGDAARTVASWRKRRRVVGFTVFIACGV